MRLQLALNVDDLDAAIDFYSAMFGTEPAKVRDGYANFAIDEPPLKLVLFAGAGANGTINHLGVEVDESNQVIEAERRLRSAGLVTSGVEETQCCYADKTETWVSSPDGHDWEWYVKQGDNDQPDNVVVNTVVPRADTASAECC